jgi:hypothetical protein
MANINLKPEREARLKAIARKNEISLSLLMQKISDAFLSNPSLFLSQFTMNSELNIQKCKDSDGAMDPTLAPLVTDI